MACRTGEACGLTETRSKGVSSANQSVTMTSAMEALGARWPPTLIPEWLARLALAAPTIAAESHRTRRAISRSTPWSYVELGASGAVGSVLVVMWVLRPDVRRRARSAHGGVLAATDDLLISEPDVPGQSLRGRRVAALGQQLQHRAASQLRRHLLAACGDERVEVTVVLPEGEH